MLTSAGLLIIQNNKILLVHPTDTPVYGSYSIPKGKLESGETCLEAAIRETKEETGIKIKESDIDPTPHKIEYTNKKGNVYKTLFYFVTKPSKKIVVDNSKIQFEEVDWVGFCDKTDAMIRIFWRFEEMLKFID